MAQGLLPAYLAVGGDELNAKEVVSRLKRRLEVGLEAFNLDEMSAGPDIEPQALLSSLNTLPMGSSFRLVIVEGADRLPKAVSEALVGYLDTEDVTTLNMGEGATYQLPVSDDFASRKPSVNVYVQANVKAANCGVGELNDATTHTALLDGAKITSPHFGLSPLVKTVPDEGLPMAGMLSVQPVVGDAPALRVGTLSKVATVPLTRVVSKLRFVFAKATGEPAIKIKSITMNAGMIPDVEYLFQTPVSITYNTDAEELLPATINDIAAKDNPTAYIYFDQEAQAYEDLIDGAGLTVHGPIYLRESDKQLAGTITYQIGDGADQTVDFQMQQAGDFLRNHTWIIYAYYAGSGKLQVQSLYVKDWTTKEMNHTTYNW